MIEYRLANAIGLDVNNAQHSVAITEALHGIEDTNSFLEFCVDKKDGIEYSTKPEKLMTLANRYKRLQENAKIPHHVAKEFSKNLAHKVEQVKNIVKTALEAGSPRPFSRLSMDGHSFFNKQEISALSELGSAGHLIELCELHTLEESIRELFISKYLKKASYTALTDGQKRIKKLLSV